MTTTQPSLREDYGAAALRHDRDARLLRRFGAYDNAAYLAGYVVECALKTLLADDAAQPRGYGHDLRRLSGEALRLAVILSPGLARYPVDELPAVSRAARTWTPDLRYAPDGALGEEDRQIILTGASEAVDRVLVELVLDGKVNLPG
jgi:hypothetical protein